VPFPEKFKRRVTSILPSFVSKVNGQYVEGFFVRNGDYRFIVAADDMVVGRALRSKGSYGTEELERILKLVSADSSVIFIGTHVGALAIPTAKKVKNCVFVEANPRTFEFLTANIALNNISNVDARNIAVGEAQGEISFVLSTFNSGGSKREPVIKDDMYYYDNPITISVPMVTLDSICAENSGEFDLVFMDIEGSEMFALKGMSAVLVRTNALIIEFIPHHLTNVANCTVGEFVEYLAGYFGYCYVPSKDKYLHSAEFSDFFEKMFSLNESDDGLVFTKVYTELRKI
jgi:FkbM family methyltransferase